MSVTHPYKDRYIDLWVPCASGPPCQATLFHLLASEGIVRYLDMVSGGRPRK